MGRTIRQIIRRKRNRNFNSLAPCGANPYQQGIDKMWSRISTHSPRVGRTNALLATRKTCVNFNSLAPCGANRRLCVRIKKSKTFQLTRPVWGEPVARRSRSRDCSISTHSPRVGRTEVLPGDTFTFDHFNSLAPCGANLGSPNSTSSAGKISTHSPRVGRTCHTFQLQHQRSHFNSLAPCGANPC